MKGFTLLILSNILINFNFVLSNSFENTTLQNDSTSAAITFEEGSAVSNKPLPEGNENCAIISVPKAYKMTLDEFRYYSKMESRNKYIWPLIGLIGLILNSINIRIWMNRENRRTSVSYYLTAMAVSDIIFGSHLLLRGCEHAFYLYQYPVYRQIFQVNGNVDHYLYWVGIMATMWLTAAVTIERAICVALPTKAR